MKLKFLCLSVPFLLFSGIYKYADSQVVTTTIGDYTLSPGQHFAAPVSVTNFSNISTFAFKIYFDPSVIHYKGDSLRNPALAGTWLVDSSGPGTIIFAYFDLNEVSLPGTAVLDYFKFTYITGACNLFWDTLSLGYGYSDMMGDMIPSIEFNGTINGGTPWQPCVNNFSFLTNGFTTTFTGSAAAGVPPYSYIWSFEDGDSAFVQSPVHTYTTPGTYYVALKTIDAMGCFAITSISIIIETPPPANPISTTIGNYTASPGQQLCLPVYITYGDGIRDVNLTLLFDPAVLIFNGDSMHNPVMDPMWVTFLQNPGQVNLNWMGAYPVSIPGTGVLDYLRFTYIGGSTSLVWDTTGWVSEYEDINFHPINSVFHNGSVCLSSPPQYFTIQGQVEAGGLPLDLGKAFLYVTSSGSGTNMPVDSCQVDTSGMYHFFNVPSGAYLVKAVPAINSGYYATYVPTYFGDTPFWNSADSICTTLISNPYNIHLVHIIGPMPGAGSIAGTISNGVKLFASGTPAVGVEILLTNVDDQPLAVCYSNSAGHFSFDNLGYGTYMVHAEITMIMDFPVTLTLSVSNPSVTNLGMHITPSGISTDIPVVRESLTGMMIIIYPNPANDLLNVAVGPELTGNLYMRLCNLLGQEVFSVNELIMRGNNSIQIPTGNYKPGLYLLQIISQEGLISEHKVNISR